MHTHPETPTDQPTNDTSRTALVVDDDEAFRQTLSIWLRDGGWTVRQAADGKEALAKLDPQVDVLTLDRLMPRLSGSELVEQLRPHEFDGPVVVVSAERPDQFLDEEMVATYLTKPIDRGEFIGTLQRLV